MRYFALAANLLFGFSLAVGCTSNVITPANTPLSPHPYDFVPEPDSTYVRNDQVSLDREYWVIYRANDGTHHMFPRPDGNPELVRACSMGDPFATLLAEARLCQSADSHDEVKRVNALSKDEALQVSAYLHARLSFDTGEGDTRPHALISDVIDVCRTFADDRERALRAVCDRELGWVDGGPRPDIAFMLSSQELNVLAKRLNELYGIE